MKSIQQTIQTVIGAMTVAMALTAAPAAQAGFGSTAYMASTNDVPGALGAPGWAPSLDYRVDGLLVQFPALNLIGGLAGQRLDFGLAVSGTLARGGMSGTTDGIFMLGGAARYFSINGVEDASAFSLLAKARLGAEIKKGDKKGMGFGIYVVPEFGISTFTDGNLDTADRDLGVAWGGGIELSCWFSGK